MLSAVVRGPVAGAQDATVLRSPFSSTPQLCGNGLALRDAKGALPSASDGRRRQCVSRPGLAGLACSGYGSTWASRSWSAASSCRCLKAETRRQRQCIWHSRRIAMSVPGSELLAESGQSWAAAFGQKQTLPPYLVSTALAGSSRNTVCSTAAPPEPAQPASHGGRALPRDW